jgi:dihydropyrimidine dehydrogenase (NAD+) subunit PreA
MAELSVDVCGVRFKNPVLIASAPTTDTLENMRRCYDVGAGGVVIKSVSDDPAFRMAIRPMFTVLHRKSYPNCFSNYSMGFASKLQPDKWLNELEKGRKLADRYQAIVVGSIFSAESPEGWAKLAKRIETAGAHMIELNLSCPNVFGTGAGVDKGTDLAARSLVTRAVVDAVKIPVFAKLTSESTDLVQAAREMKNAKAHGVTIMNRNPSLDIDIETGQPLLAGGFAGLGGPWMRPFMLKWVARVAAEVGIAVSATNGIWVWQDVIKAIMCGAHTVQVCTVVMMSRKGMGIVKDFLMNIEKYLDERGISTIAHIRGKTLPQIRSFATLERREKGEVWVELKAEECTKCNLCANWCYFFAIEKARSKKELPRFIRENCEGCGLCAALCPAGAIEIKGEGPFVLGSSD